MTGKCRLKLVEYKCVKAEFSRKLFAMNQNVIGKKIQELRHQKGFTQEDLADRTGLSVRTIQRIENGEVDPRYYTIDKLAVALDVNREMLMGEFDQDAKSVAKAKNWAALFHLSGLFILFLPPLLIWILKKDEIPELREHAKAVFNFQLSMIIFLFCGGFLVLVIVGLPILIFLGIYSTVIILLNTVKVAQGREYRYPLSLQLIKQL